MRNVLRYRGKLKDADLLLPFEDHIVEESLEVEGYAQIWRSRTPKRPGRIVRGVYLDLTPGLETLSFLVSPEMTLLPIASAEAAEEGPLADPPWIEVRTGFAGPEWHIAVVALLEVLGRYYFRGLQVQDDTGYWQTRDPARLAVAWGGAIAPNDFMPRAMQIMDKVHFTIVRPPEHPPVRFTDEEGASSDDRRYGTEEEWDAFYKDRERKQSRLMRSIDEQTCSGRDAEGAFEEAMRSEGIIDLPQVDGPEEDAEEAPSVEDLVEEEDVAEAWKAAEAAPPDDDDPLGRHSHPLLRRATRLMLRAMELAREARDQDHWPLSTLMKGVMEMSGGLVQALPARGEDEADAMYGHRLTQLKRALRGVVFAAGSVGPAGDLRLLRPEDAREIAKELDVMACEVRLRVGDTRRLLMGRSGPDA